MVVLDFEGAIEDIRAYLEKATDPISGKEKKGFTLVKPSKSSKILQKKGKRKDEPDRVHRFRNVFAKHVEVMADFVAPVFPKTKTQREELKEALAGNFIFEHLDESSKEDLLNAMEPVKFSKDQVVITQGEIGDYMYVIENGTVQFLVDGTLVGKGKTGQWFGELAIMYDCPRAATVICETDCQFWRVEQATVRKIRAARAIQTKSDARKAADNVSFLKDLDEETKKLFADALKVKYFSKDEVLVQKGTACNTWFYIKEGTVRASDLQVGDTRFENIDILAGEYFGHSMLQAGVPWIGNAVANTDGMAFTMSKEEFLQILSGAHLEDIIMKDRQAGMLAAVSIIANTDLNRLELHMLMEQLQEKTYKKGHVFYKRGKVVTNKAIYILRSGSVAFTSTMFGLGGPDKVLRVDGEVFGDDLLVPPPGSKKQDVVAKHTITATEDVTCLVLTLEAIESVILDTSRLGTKLAKFAKIDKSLTLASLKQYRILGAGTFGQVWLVSKKDKEIKRSIIRPKSPSSTGAGADKTPYALKIQYKRDIIGFKQVEGVINEKNIMEAMDHPFVIGLVNYFQDELRIYMVMQLLQGGELFGIIHTEDYDGIPEAEANFYAAGMLEGLSYMHRRKILHRDLKGENVLMDRDGYCVIIDLGFAKVVPDKTYTCCGTPIFMAPEVLLGEGHNHGADLWSLGVLIYDMLYGSTPFYEPGMKQVELFERIVRAKFRFPNDVDVSPEAKNLITNLLIPEPSYRLGCATRGDLDIRDHRWFMNVDFGKLYRKELKAPWVPNIKDPFDVSQYDDWSELERKNQKMKRKPLSNREQRLFNDF